MAIKGLCEHDFAFFIRYVFKEFYNVKWINNWHHDAIINLIMQLENRSIANAVVNIPPRYAKTELCVILWISWSIIRNQRAQFIHASYSDELALKNSNAIRTLLMSECIQKHWQVKMRKGSDSNGLWLTTQGGGLLATSSGGAITGFGAGIASWATGDKFDGAIIIDDPLKADAALSETARNTVNERLSSTFHSRKNHPQVPILIVMQRLHDDDASAYAMAGKIMGDKFDALVIPAIGKDGTALHPAKHDIAALEIMRASNSYVFAGQYMQRPAPVGGGIFKAAWFKRHEYIEPFNDFEMIVHSWDTAYKADQHNDPSACTIWGIKSGDAYLLHVINERMEYPALKQTIVKTYERFGATHVLIEDKASGQSLLQEIKNNTSMPVIAINPVGDKLTRAVASTAMIEGGRIHLPINASWLSDYEHQLCTFPNAKNDDMVDATSQFINYWKKRKRVFVNGVFIDN